ncbi:hypothetical protein [Paludisphaera sp.]|uniref:hypothetical protein n=1 Tax=Paludisphaera sp. TaxID=2017432 RepID=UPI00301DC877
MRRTTSALTTTILGAVLAAPTVSAQQSPPARDVSTSAESDAGFGMAAARGARHLLRNGLDYIDYQEFERALRYLREAERRQAELNEPERTKLKQAIDRAQRGTRESIGSERPYAVSQRTLRSGGFAPAEADPAVASKSRKARPAVATEGEDTPEPIRLAGAEAPAPPEGRSPSRIASAPSSLPEIPEAPAFDLDPDLAGDAPAREPAPTLAPAPEAIDEAPTAPPVVPIGAAEPVEAGLPPFPAVDLPPSLPSLEPTPAADPAVALSRNAPVGAPEPDPSAPAPAPIQLELPDEIASEPVAAKAPTPPAPREAPPAEEADEPEAPTLPDAATLAPADEPEPMALDDADLDDPALDLPALPAELTEAPAEVDSDLPGLPPEVTTLPELPAEIPAESAPAAALAPRPEVQPLPVPAPAPAPEPVDDEEPASDREPVEIGADLDDFEEPAPAAGEPMPAPAAVEAPAPAPAPARLPNLAPTPGRTAGSGFIPSRAAPTSTLSPDLERRVEEMAAAQEQATRDRVAGETPPALPEEGMGGVDSLDDSISDTRMQTQIDISRAPSPAEARPISAVPVPEDWVPLGAREWSPQRKYWAAAATCHLPLYFQDPMLERYGHSVENYMGPGGRFFTYPVDKPSQSTQRNQILQPAASVGQFAFQLLTLPYALVVDPPWESQYDLGYWRPGDRIPTDLYYLPTHGTGPPLKGSKY